MMCSGSNNQNAVTNILVFSMKHFEETLAPFRLNEGQLDERTAQQQRTEFPWKVTDKVMDALRLKVCVFDLNVQL